MYENRKEKKNRFLYIYILSATIKSCYLFGNKHQYITIDLTGKIAAFNGFI